MIKLSEYNNNITIYKSEDGQISFNVNVLDETVWLNQKQIAELFEVQRPAITKHLKNIYDTGELEEKNTSSILEHMGTNEQLYKTKHYNLDVVISVGYRINSMRATQFRIWATQILKQYMMNGYAINETRIKAIEDKLDNLSISLGAELRSEFREEIKEINKTLLQIANRPININNQISLTSDKLEDKIIELLDELIEESKHNKKLKAELEEVKAVIKTPAKDENAKRKIKRLGSAKKIVAELVRLGGGKLKDLFW
jgi:predicted XRE-type DNA-binding protein